MKINKLGLWLVMVHSVIAMPIFYIDTMDAVSHNSSGFALIPLFMIDIPAFIIASPIRDFLDMFIPHVLDNTPSVILRDTLIHKGSFAIPAFILGGLQWYCIGWLISGIMPKIKNRFKK